MTVRVSVLVPAVAASFAIILCGGCSDQESSGASASETALADAGAANNPASDTAEAGAQSGYTAPSARGPHTVGTVRYEWVDTKRKRKVPVRVWYPAQATGDGDAVYLFLLKGDAHEDAKPEASSGPYPLVLFSHGFQGAAEQSYSLCEHVASWGFVVAAPDHVTNTLFDFDATDEDAAQVSAERPADVAFAANAVKGSASKVAGIIDQDRSAIIGHSFGGWTALVVAGASVDIAHAKAQCKAGAKSDIMCKYIALMPDGVVQLAAPISGLKAAIYLAPGGYSSFGDGLQKVSVPGLVVGGTKDTTTSVDVEITPIYEGLPEPKAKLVIQDAGHMSFTDVCSLSFAKTMAGLKEMCAAPGRLAPDRATLITRTFIVAFLDRYVRGKGGAAKLFAPAAAAALFKEAEVVRTGVVEANSSGD